MIKRSTGLARTSLAVLLCLWRSEDQTGALVPLSYPRGPPEAGLAAETKAVHTGGIDALMADEFFAICVSQCVLQVTSCSYHLVTEMRGHHKPQNVLQMSSDPWMFWSVHRKRSRVQTESGRKSPQRPKKPLWPVWTGVQYC